MVGPSSGFNGGAAKVADTSNAASASTAATRGLSCGLVEFGIMGTRILNAFDRRSRYSFELGLLPLGFGLPVGGGAPLGDAPAPELASPSKSFVARAATWAMFSLLSFLWPPRSMVTVACFDVGIG